MLEWVGYGDKQEGNGEKGERKKKSKRTKEHKKKGTVESLS